MQWHMTPVCLLHSTIGHHVFQKTGLYIYILNIMYSMNHRSVERWALHRSVNLRGLVFKHQIGTFEMRSQITCEAVQHGAKGQAMFFNQILGEGFDYFSQERVNVSFICYWRGLEKASMFLLRNVSQKQQSVNDYSSWFVDVAIF